MYSIAICDDTSEMLSEISGLVSRYIKENPGKFSEAVLFDNPLKLSTRIEDGGVFDVLLLDIFMTEASGIDVAREQRENSNNCQIIFITTTRDFAVEAIALSATHYIVKPISYTQLCEALDRAYTALASAQTKTVVLKSRCGELYKVNVADVISIECFGHIQKIKCNDYEFETRDNMPLILKDLIDERFFSIRKGAYINMDCIKFIGRDYVTMCDNQRIVAAKRSMPEFRKKYINYVMG